MLKILWLERQFKFGQPKGMLPFFIERLSGTEVRLREKIKGYAEEVLASKTGGKWSVKENIAHLAEVGMISTRRVDEIKKGAATLSSAMLPLTADYNSQSIADVIELFRRTRNESIAQYQQLQEDDLDKTAMHPRLKVTMSAVDLCFFDAEHDDHHLVRINEILETSKNS